MIPSIASRLEILADMADQMEQNEENRNNIQQQLFFKYLIESIQKQQDKPVDFSMKITEQSLYPFASYLSSKNSILSEKLEKSNTPPLDINQYDPYWERRKKNNEAAKRSRDTRRAKEDEIALRATLLEQENVKLRLQNAHLKQENIQLRCQIYSSIKS